MLFYELVYKPTFRNQLLALPPEAIPLIEDKTRLLTIDPEPKAKNKKRLKGTKGNIYRIRAGDYRIVYTYGSGRVSLLGVDHRKSVYSDDWDDDEPELDGSIAKPEEPGTVRPVRRTSARDTRVPDYFTSDDLVSANDNNLPRDLDQEFLTRIQVPETHHRSLMRCRTLDDLIAVEIPAHIRERIFDTLVTPNYDHVLTQADYTVDSVEDFRRMLEGELVPMLLRLDPEQERHVNWPLAGTGPVLLKGAPGTGKSVVAVYRVRSLINALRGSGLQEPRILFASYTNALVNSARHLLNGLLGADAALVDIFTVDTVVSHLYAANGCSYAPIPDDGLRRAHIHKALKQMSCGDDSNQSLAQSIAKLSADYLFEEIDQVIVGRDLEEEDDYLTGPRPGRRVPLTEQQRRAVWRLYELVEQHTGLSQPQSYAQTRRLALRGVRDGWHAERYDGVVIDEAQDLSPTSIRLLFALAKSPDRLFLTADSNQCIYGNSFRWKDVHGDLQFRGRTSILRRNFRSTRQIVEAAAGFLTGAALDDEETDAVEHMRSGPKPVALRLENRDQEVTELVTYLRETTRALRVGLTSCAVLVGTERVGQDIAGRLRDAGLPVEFMKGKQVDLERPVLTVTTFQSAKGLEFPIVAVAGLDKAPQFLAIEDSPQAEEQHMIHRRVLYVAMTRAMYALAVFLPWTAPEIHINCFTSESWLNERPASWTAWLDEVTALEPTSVSESHAA